MNVPSFSFLAFALVGALLFNITPARPWGRLVLLVVNVAFFCTFLRGPASAIPYLAFLGVGYAGTLLLSRRPSTLLFLVFFTCVLIGFFDLKRYGIIPAQAQIPWLYTTVGLSYVFFRVLHLLIDARQGMLPARISPLSYVNYTLNFTALVSGPIQLYPDYRRTEVETRLPLDLFVVSRACERMVIGFFKVAVVSTLLLKLQQGRIDHLDHGLSIVSRSLDVAIIGATYPLFLYANFSGYTDFVIGVARLYRLELPENFDAPFLAENYLTFWTRWHMTLSNWLKTYVYTPLLMSMMRRLPSQRVEPYLGVIAYFVTFFLVGAWHGQTSEFLLFGVLQGGGVAVNKLYQVLMTAWLSRKGYRALAARPAYRALSRGLTFTWFAFSMLWFWASWAQLQNLLRTVGWGAALLGWSLVLLGAVVGLAVTAGLFARRAGGRASAVETTAPSPSRYWRTVVATAMVVLVIAFTVLLTGPAPDIVYKAF